MKRTMDAARLNAVANDPAVRPWLGGDGAIDLQPVLDDPRNVAVEAEHGGFVAVSLGDGSYEVHSLFLPDKGDEAIATMRQGLDYLFGSTDAISLVTKVPDGNVAAAGLARLAMFRPIYDIVMPWTGGARLEMGVWSLPIDRWAATSRWARVAGVEAHQQMAQALPNLSHAEDDDAHLQFSGAAWLLCRAGQALKAQALYNRYAAVSGHPAMTVIGLHPIVVDLGELIVELRGDAVEVVRCR